jgi:hypothetical protein
MSQSTMQKAAEIKAGDGPQRNQKTPRRERLVEHVADWRTAEVTVDAGSGVIANVALSGLVSKNGYRYTEAALRDAAPLYAGKPVFLDHAPDPGRPQERSTRDLAGSIVRPRFHEGRLRADIATNATDAGRTLLALAERDQPGVGMSHVVLAERNSDGTVVEKIHEVVSVDAVVFPATTQTFREHAAQERQPQRDENASRGDGGDAVAVSVGVLSEEQHARIDRRLVALSETLEQLRIELSRRGNGRQLSRSDSSRNGAPANQAARLRIERLIAEAGLPECALTVEFLTALERCPNDELLRALLEERREFVRQLGTRLPTSHERQADADAHADGRRAEEALIRAVRGDASGVLGLL